MLSTVARTLRTNTIKRTAFPITTLIRTKVTLPDLPYDYNGLEPYINEEIMRLHHSKHHQTYVNAYNQAEEKLSSAFQANDLTQQIALQNALKFNGGGHINHTLFWQNLAPEKEGGGQLEKGELYEAIEKEFGSFDGFVQEFNAAAAAVQGSGWAWLGYNKSGKRLEIATTPNQDPLLHLTPLLGVDVWEHVR
ncbi:hypothetical protein RO3G_10619 [Rhizopus delemar RA 99-880]|uniref:Superoxide dismutase n=1 Tax=Rhizopus delemar (strain RA 99-880 / ATCC MYA-4621 / FGSC 9543 / NRRL 43880) TaxID=246409 RepID=I1CBS9_RHIO9|nr:hypothetical protein RO3G_10619 [Rhizopus delemar RA 99-880]|eukprot:EIE85909.1 hypothetical protein RO3G_10619 [Rhizopus delemar RA 99-880]